MNPRFAFFSYRDPGGTLRVLNYDHIVDLHREDDKTWAVNTSEGGIFRLTYEDVLKLTSQTRDQLPEK